MNTDEDEGDERRGVRIEQVAHGENLPANQPPPILFSALAALSATSTATARPVPCCCPRGAGDCVREAVAVPSEGGAVEEGEVEADEAVHGLPQEGGVPD